MKRRGKRQHWRPDNFIDPATGLPKAIAVFRCVCGKSAFSSRKAARGALRRTFPGESNRMQVYSCSRRPDGLEIWHFGHPVGDERERSA